MSTNLRCFFGICLLMIATLNAEGALQKYDVVIVGGGMAGLSAAEYLVNHGITNIAVLEAKDRLGGRIQTLYLPTGPVENGAQWIHGGKINNNIFNMANINKLIDHDKCTDTSKIIFIHSEGFQVEEHLYEKFMDDLEAYREKIDRANLDKGTSVEKILNDAFESITANYSVTLKNYLRPIFNSHKVSLRFDEGDDLDIISAATDYNLIPCNIEIKGGNDQFIDIIKNNVGDERIFLDHEVMKITWNDQGAILTVNNDNELFEFAADYVICTVSLGVLKHRSSDLFAPRLPQQKLDAMNRLVFGRGVKIHLYYEKPFWWQNHLRSLQLGFTDERYEKGKTDWIHRVSAFFECPDNPNVLLTVVFGNVASDVELLSNKEIGRRITSLLRNFTEDITIPEPSKVYKSNWIHDKHILGTYTSGSTSYANNEFDILGKPLPENGVPRLLFAGEATVPKIYSTMHGARHSGVREAIRIIQQMNRN